MSDSRRRAAPDAFRRGTHALERHPVPIGGLVAVALLPVHALLPTAAADALAALVLALIGHEPLTSLDPPVAGTPTVRVRPRHFRPGDAR